MSTAAEAKFVSQGYSQTFIVLSPNTDLPQNKREVITAVGQSVLRGEIEFEYDEINVRTIAKSIIPKLHKHHDDGELEDYSTEPLDKDLPSIKR